MTEKLQIDLPVLLPDIAHDADAVYSVFSLN